MPDSVESLIESAIDNQLIEDWEMMPDKEAVEEATAEASDAKAETGRR